MPQQVKHKVFIHRCRPYSPVQHRRSMQRKSVMLMPSTIIPYNASAASEGTRENAPEAGQSDAAKGCLRPLALVHPVSW